MAKEFIGGKFNITKKENVYDGHNSKIDLVALSSGKHSLKLLRKNFRGYRVEFMEGPEWHTLLKKKGYPVFPTWRYDAENKVEYITDLRRGGTHRVIDFCGDKDNYEKVNISNIEELKADVKKLLDKSANDRLFINEPNIFFDVEISTGIAKVLLGDLRELEQAKSYVPREEVFVHNQNVLNILMYRLDDILK